MNLKINKLQHVGIPVTNIKRSEAFYEKLGFKNIMFRSFVYNGDNGKVIMMGLGEIIMELYQMPENELKEIKSRQNGHIDHIAFDVDDIDTTFATLQAANYTIVEPEPVLLQFWENGCRYFNIIGPDGERLEFNQVL